MLYLSGVPCEGADMDAAVAQCYRRLTTILQRFGADSSQVVRETIYTTDIDALVKAIPGRRTFFADARYPAATWVEVRRPSSPDSCSKWNGRCDCASRTDRPRRPGTRAADAYPQVMRVMVLLRSISTLTRSARKSRVTAVSGPIGRIRPAPLSCHTRRIVSCSACLPTAHATGSALQVPATLP